MRYEVLPARRTPFVRFLGGLLAFVAALSIPVTLVVVCVNLYDSSHDQLRRATTQLVDATVRCAYVRGTECFAGIEPEVLAVVLEIIAHPEQGLHP